MTDRRVQVRLPNAPSQYSAQEEAGFRRSVAQAIQDAATKVTDLVSLADIEELGTAVSGDWFAIFDTSAGTIKKIDAAAFLGTTPALGDLTDVTLTGPLQDGDFLRYNGSAWVDTPLVAGDIPAHDIISTHSASGLTTGHVLRATGATTFAFGAIQSGDLPSHTHLETEITDGAILARVADPETISGAWTFTNSVTTFDAGGAQTWLDINTDLAGLSGIRLQHNNLTAFEISVDHGTEDFYIYRWEPDGTRWSPEFEINQNTGKVTISNDLEVTGFNISWTGINSHTAPTSTGSQILVRDPADNGEMKVISAPPADTIERWLSFDSNGGGFQWSQLVEADISDLGTYLTAAGNETISGLWTFTAKATFDQGTLGGFAPAFTRNIEALYDGSSATGNDLGILGFVRQTVATTGGPQGLEGYALTSHTTGAVALAIGTVGNAESNGAGTVTDLRGGSFTVGISGTGNVTAGKGIHIAGGYETSTGNFVDLYGLFIDDQTVGTTNYAIYTKAGLVSFGDDLYLRDSTTYPADGLLYVTSTGLVASSGASAQYDIPYNIDGSAWSYISKGANPDGSILMLVSGIPQWSTASVGDADTLDGQHGAYYLALGNATGTLAATKLQLLAEGTVFIGGVSANEARALTGDDIDWTSAFGGASTQIYLDGATSSFRSSLGLYAGAQETSSINYTTAYLRGQYVTTAVTGQQGSYQYVLSAGEDSRGIQLATGYGADDYSFYIRRGSDNAGSENGANAWQLWKEIAVNGTNVNGFTFSGNPALLLSHTQPEIRFYETDADTDEKYWRFYAAGGVFSLLKMNDALGSTGSVITFTRAGTTVDFANWYVHDIRYGADGNDAQYHRWYANSNTGQTHLEMRRTFDSAMAWRITGQASTGDFYLSNYNFSTLQEHWIFGDASTGELTFDGQRVTLTPQIRASATYNNGDQSAATLNVNWDLGNSQRCHVDTGNATINVNQASAYQGTAYTMEVTNIHATTGRTVTWSGVSSWVGSSPTATLDAGKMTVVQIYVARNRAGSNYIIGSLILDNVTVPT